MSAMRRRRCAGTARSRAMQTAAVQRRGSIVWILIAMILLLGATVVVLAWEVRVLKPQADDLRRRKALPYVGQLVPVVHTVSMTSDLITIGETTKGRSQVLFFLATSCEYCRATYSEWVAIADELLADSAHRFNVYGVSLSPRDSTLAYVAEHAPPFPVVNIEDLRTSKLFRVKGVPMTLVIDHKGQIAYVHPSVIRTRAQSDSILAAARLVVDVTADSAQNGTIAVGRAPAPPE
jgi:cytochrome oxidase Cu insertion factor (SCO1/SenC/PrrC family)